MISRLTLPDRWRADIRLFLLAYAVGFVVFLLVL